jgi:hypothetical protein
MICALRGIVFLNWGIVLKKGDNAEKQSIHYYKRTILLLSRSVNLVLYISEKNSKFQVIQKRFCINIRIKTSKD